MSASHDLTGLRRGNSFARVFRFKNGTNLVDLTGSTLVFRATTATGVLRKSTAEGTLQMAAPASGEVTLRLTPSETRQFAVGKIRNRYEIERWAGADETTLVAGHLVVEEGINDDD